MIYYTKNEKCPVIDFLRSLPRKDQVKTLRDLDLLQEYGFELGLPYLKKMQNAEDLWEVRTKFSSNRYRVFFFSYVDGNFILLHGFQKKTDKTPPREIQLALSRKHDYIERGLHHET